MNWATAFKPALSSSNGDHEDSVAALPKTCTSCSSTNVKTCCAHFQYLLLEGQRDGLADDTRWTAKHATRSKTS